MFTAAAGEDRGAAQGLRRQGVRRARQGVQRDAAAHAADRRDPLRRAARDARRRWSRSSTPASPDGIEELLAERALVDRHVAARGHRPAARADGRGAGPAPAAALHRGRVPGGVHAARRQDPAPRARPLRDHARPGAAAHGRPRPDRHPLRPRHLRHRARARRHGRPRRAARARATRCTTPSPTRPSRAGTRRSIAARSSSRRPSRSRACSSASSRRSPTRPETAVARRFGYAYIDEHGAVEAAGPAPYLDCVAAPLTNEVIAARGAAVARRRPRSRRRAGSSPTSCRRS